MTLENATQWLQNHSHIIPALEINHQQVIELFENEHQAHNLVNIVVSDPGMSLALLSLVNQKRDSASGKEPVESAQAAIALLGDSATYNLFKEFPIAEQTLQEQNQLFLFQQIINRSFHCEIQAGKWASNNGYQQLEPITQAGLLAYIGEILCCVYDFDKYNKYIHSDHSENSELQFFSFVFDELTMAIGKKFNLPELIIRSLPLNNDNGQRSQLVKFLSLVCHQCEHGWYSETMQKIQNEFADCLQISADKIALDTHQYALDATRNSLIPEAWPIAARLILIDDHLWQSPYKIDNKPAAVNSVPEKLKPSTEETTTDSPEPVPDQPELSTTEQIKLLLKNPETTQSEILKTCINGLHRDTDLSKISLLLISKDRKMLRNSINAGIEEKSPLRHYKIELSKSGLLKILLKKPQAIWINNNTFKKYQKIIPGSFQANIMTNNFFAMSLFINEIPIGIIYADSSDTDKELTDKLFTEFKQIILLTSKALTLLVKKQQSKKA